MTAYAAGRNSMIGVRTARKYLMLALALVFASLAFAQQLALTDAARFA